jgi:novobiocin biosynthesis protein NovU/D-mycarose 3-C-methyltransferase
MKTLNFCRICRKKKFKTVFSYNRVASDGIYLEKPKKNDNTKQTHITLLMCANCKFLQLKEIIQSDIYEEYNFASSHIGLIDKWLKKISSILIKKYNLKNKSILEIGSGDGSFLELFAKTNSVLGIEPSKKLVNTANKKGAISKKAYFNSKFAKKLNKKFDVIILRHVLEHIADLNEFIKSAVDVLSDDGIIYIESPNAKEIIKTNNYFNIFYEHVNYFTLTSLQRLLKNYLLNLEDYGYNNIHNGSLYGIFSKKGKIKNPIDQINSKSIEKFGLNFALMKNQLIKLRTKLKGKIVGGYGAANKTFSILNIGDFKINEIKEIFDKNPNLQRKFIPYYNIPIVSPKNILSTNPQLIIVFATAYQEEIIEEIKKIGYKGSIVKLFPKIKIINV